MWYLWIRLWDGFLVVEFECLGLIDHVWTRLLYLAPSCFSSLLKFIIYSMLFGFSYTHDYLSHCHMILFLWYSLFVSIFVSIWLSSVCWVLMSCLELYSGDTFGVWYCDLECLCLSCCVNRLFYSSLLWTFLFYTCLWTVS